MLTIRRVLPAILIFMSVRATTAQTAPAPKEPPPRWDVQLGASFVGTSGNSQTTTLGADSQMHRRWTVWQLESTATAVRASDRGVRTAERYLGTIRGQRKLSSLLGLTAGERAERDRLAGIDIRSISDAGLSWALIRETLWTLDGLTSLAWNHEQPVIGLVRNDPVGVLQASSKVALGPSADTTQRFTWYPDFRDSSAYRSEAEITAQAAMNSRLALKVGYLWRFSNAPVPGFVRSDNTATASVVMRWKAEAPAAAAP